MKKTCTLCKKEKPENDFAKDEAYKSGLKYLCKDCCKNEYKKYKWRVAQTFLELVEDGDIITFYSTRRRIRIEEVNKRTGKIWLYIGKKLRRTTAYQIVKSSTIYRITKKGDILKTDISYYDPVKDEIIVINKGSIYLGKV